MLKPTVNRNCLSASKRFVPPRPSAASVVCTVGPSSWYPPPSSLFTPVLRAVLAISRERKRVCVSRFWEGWRGGRGKVTLERCERALGDDQGCGGWMPPAMILYLPASVALTEVKQFPNDLLCASLCASVLWRACIPPSYMSLRPCPILPARLSPTGPSYRVEPRA